MSRVAVFIATFGYVGYFPIAPGTAGSLAALPLYALVRWSGSVALELATIVVVLVGIAGIHILADVLPHVLAAKTPVRLALASAPALLLIARWTRWFTGPVERLEDRIVTRNGEEPLSDEERELREIQELGEKEGVLEKEEGLLVERAFRFDDFRVRSVDNNISIIERLAWR